MEKSQGLFVIRRNNKLLAMTGIVGLIISILGAYFLYSNSIMPNEFCKWVGIITTAVGLILIYRAITYFNTSLITADGSGIWFDIAVFGKSFFIPWNAISKIENEEFGMLASRYKSRTPCLVFEINREYSDKIPALLKSVYYKSGNRIYFATGILSTTVDNAVTKLRCIQKGLSRQG